MCQNTPSAASLLIDSLHPKERAILYSALLIFKNEAEINFAKHINDNQMAPPLALRISEFLRWNIKEANDIIHKLFAECFPEDLDTLPHFQKDLPLLITGKVDARVIA